MRSVLLLCTFLLSGACTAPAQDSPDYHAPDFAARTFVPGVEVAPTPGLPFSASEIIVWKRQVEGTGTITSTLESRIMRDSQGRVYRERHHFGSPNATADATLYQFYVMDPVAHTVTICLKPQRVCHIVPLTQPPAPPQQRVGPFNGGKEYFDRHTLGTQLMQNLQVQGTLETTTIQPGTFGNDQILTLTRELWYSPDLQINLTVVRKDPRTGTQDVRVNVVSRTDPDAAAFAVPAGYRVEDNRPSSVRTTPQPVP